jgi:hypothetical protein
MCYRHGGGQRVILCLYVDDILIFRTSLDVINEVKTFLCQSFDYSDIISLCGKGFELFQL